LPAATGAAGGGEEYAVGEVGVGARVIRTMSDHEAMKLNNQLIVLGKIRESGPITRVELQKRTKLSWGTITSSIKELLQKELIVELGSVTTGVGRRPVELDMNVARNLVLGLDLGSSFIRSILIDVKGRVVDAREIPMDAEGSRQAILDTLLEAGRSLLERHGVPNRCLAGIGIAAPGAVDFRNGVCHYAPHHPNWREVPLKEVFSRQFGVPCFVDHVSNCFALSEKLFGYGRELDSFTCVLLGTGVSAGIVIHGEVYRGADNFSGEFGHMCLDLEGPRCACGNRGCLEVYTSGSALARSGAQEARKNRAGALATLSRAAGGPVTGETVYQAALLKDAASLSIFRDMGRHLGVGVSNLVNLLNPQVIVLGGQVSKASPFFLPSLRKVLDRCAWPGSTRDVRVSALENGTVLGAAAIVFQEIIGTGRFVHPHSHSHFHPQPRLTLEGNSA
jgi:glucokinase-like ROK family protein